MTSKVESLDFGKEGLCVLECLDDLFGLVPVLDDHGVFHEQGLQIACLVDLRHELTLSDLPTFIDKESHDCLGHKVTNILLDDAEVAVDEVLNDSGLHNHPCAFLILSSLHPLSDLVKDDLREISSPNILVSANNGVVFVAHSDIGRAYRSHGHVSFLLLFLNRCLLLVVRQRVLVVPEYVLKHAVLEFLVGIGRHLLSLRQL